MQADKKFVKALKNKFSTDYVDDNFTITCEGFYDDTIKQFEENAFILMMEDSNWGEAIKQYKKELSSNLIKMIESERHRQIEKLFTISVDKISDALEEEITQPIKDLEDDFWDIIIERYKKIVTEEEEDVKKILNDGFKSEEEDYDNFLNKLEEKIYHNSRKMIVKTTSELNSHLNRKFNHYFKKDANGKSRDWKKIPEEEIQKLHEECVNQFKDVYAQFKKIEIPHYVSQSTPTMSSTYGSSKEQLLSADDITKVIDRFEED